MSYRRIAFAADDGLYMVMSSLLRSEGIDIPELAVSGHVSVAGADQGRYVEVSESQSMLACEILQEHGYGEYLLR